MTASPKSISEVVDVEDALQCLCCGKARQPENGETCPLCGCAQAEKVDEGDIPESAWVL